MIRRMLLVVTIAGALAAAPVALAWAGKPSGPPPRPPSDGAPPPAWAETQTRSTWLAYGGYCWTTTCVTMIPPQTRADIPVLRVRRGVAVRVHLGFAPSTVSVRLGSAGVASTRSGRLVTLRAVRGGLLQLTARDGRSATFVVRIRIL